MPQEQLLSIDIQRTLEFFDEKPEWSRGHATAIVGVLGEDLAAAAFQHCLERSGGRNISVLDETVGTGGRKGPRLDRWIEADLRDDRRVLFQTEIKNWSAHAIHGKKLKVDTSSEDLARLKQERWNELWDDTKRQLRDKYIAKALRPMQPPNGQTDRRILPLLIFWQPLGPSLQSEHENQAEGGHIFSLPRPQLQFEFEVSDTAVPMYPFPELWVFSVSSYLRSLSQPIIQLEMPNALARLHVLNRLTNLLET